MLALLKRVGISEYSIFRRDELLFLYMHVMRFRCDVGPDRSGPVNIRWQQAMSAYFVPKQETREGERFPMMQEVFYPEIERQCQKSICGSDVRHRLGCVLAFQFEGLQARLEGYVRLVRAPGKAGALIENLGLVDTPQRAARGPRVPPRRCGSARYLRHHVRAFNDRAAAGAACRRACAVLNLQPEAAITTRPSTACPIEPL